MKRVAQSCGAIGMGTVDRILRNLRFDLSQRKVLLVFDEAQHLSIACLETLRELLDQPPHCGLLFAGTHELEQIFTRQALELEQWRFPVSCRPGPTRHLRGRSSDYRAL
jgi:DNA transposition AAA+ family ATPase